MCLWSQHWYSWRETEAGDLQCKAILGYVVRPCFQKQTHEQLARYLALLLALFSFLPSYIRKYNAVLSYKEKYIKQTENALVLLSLLPPLLSPGCHVVELVLDLVCTWRQP